MRILLTIALCLSALTVEARCRGVDMRPLLSATQQSALQQEAAKVPFSQGNHWIATRGNRTVHIVGTMHINDSRLNKVMRNLTPIIRQANAILLEVSLPEAKRFRKTVKEQKHLFLLPKGQSIQNLMSPAGWKALTQTAAKRRLNMDNIVKFQPWFVSRLLTGSACGPRGMFAMNGLDRRIEKQARRNRIPLGSLETVNTAIAILGQPPLRDQVQMLQFGLMQTARSDHDFITTREAYFDEIMGQAEIMRRQQFYRDFPGPKATKVRLWAQTRHGLLAQRNQNWIPIIARTKGNMLLVAVGAAHLPGHKGLLNLMRKAGYKMQRAAF